MAKIREEKEKFKKNLKDKINNTCSTNDKTWEKLAKQIMNASKSSEPSCPLLIDYTVIIDDTNKANIMNDYFVKQHQTWTSSLMRS